MNTNSIALKKNELMFPVCRMLFLAVLFSVSLLLSFPVYAQAASSSAADETFFYTRVGEPAHATHDYTTRSDKDVRLIFAVKKNILYDVASAINIEAEVPMFNRFSLMLEYVFPWWETGNKYCLQMVELGPEFRFWLNKWDRYSKDKMQGWFGGVYVMSAKYDFQLDVKFNYQGEYYSAGVSVGYVHQIKDLFGKPTNARLEFSIAAGYLQTDFRHYLPTDDYSVLIRDKYNVGRVSYFGPTKAKISLVIPVFANNDNNRR